LLIYYKQRKNIINKNLDTVGVNNLDTVIKKPPASAPVVFI
jgi:hypothetical protein